MQQLTDVASIIFNYNTSAVQASVQKTVVCMQFVCFVLLKSLANCVNIVFKSLHDWIYVRPVMRSFFLNCEFRN